jgi:preprotein translocase subunit YajC
MHDVFKIGSRVITQAGTYRVGTVLKVCEGDFSILVSWDDGTEYWCQRQALWVI